MPRREAGDLGLASKSKDVAARKNDFWQYSMTVFCMVTQEMFGTRKYKAEDIPTICDELSEVVRLSGTKGKVRVTYQDLPELLLKVFPGEIAFIEVIDRPSLQDWSFFERGEGVSTESSTNPIARARHRKVTKVKIQSVTDSSTTHACKGIN